METVTYDHQNKKRRRKRIKIYLLSFLVVGLLLGGLYWFTYSSFFKIKSITINGIDTPTQESFLNELRPLAVRGALANLLGPDHYYSWTTQVQSFSPKFARLTITKNFWSRSITVTVTPRERFGIWCAKPNVATTDSPPCYWFDRDAGILFEAAPFPEGTLISKITESDDSEPAIGEAILPSHLLPNFWKIIDLIKKRDLPIYELSVNKNLEELKAVTVPGADIIFSLRFDPDQNLASALEILLGQTPLQKISYLDLTVPNKIYLKEK